MLITACARVEPVDDNALEAVDPIDSSELIETQDDAAARTPGLRFAWRMDNDTGAAVWGPQGQPAGTDPKLSVLCTKDGGQPQLTITRYAIGDAEAGAGTLRVSGNGASAMIPVAMATGDSQGQWTANVGPGDLMRSLANAFAGIGMVDITLSGAEPLQVASAKRVRDIFANCAGPAEAEGGEDDGTAIGNSQG
ncbi:hypothetical protein [Sphingomicrobium lutaoense]|uniref:Uncharacterized protein n=1 Tax=Sphingomicrobium lutaoense TaxID=515949 RepID=A0A839YZS7_9SPHN|nr:hypothetical protein [Sphingomicrobium lutaoense]MBB3764506.1 hypothetical protein [Sphingomicrobium lutaoense]